MVYIMAEAGVNHNGSLSIAKKLVDTAVYCGVDGVKFQTFKAENIVSGQARKARYQTKNGAKGGNQLEMLKRLELSFEQFKELRDYCKTAKISFASTPFDIESIEFLATLDVPFWKIPSGEITNYPYLSALARTGKPVMLSTGMSTLCEVEEAIRLLRKNGSGPITLLQCNTSYPTPPENANLLAMRTMSDAFGLPVGYSDHTEGVEIALAAVALGACVVEKHFTLDKNMEGPDHRASLNPEELYNLVTGIRKIEAAMGNGIKKPTESEKINITAVRKSIVASRSVKKGEIFTAQNLTAKRPANGLSPMEWPRIIGKKAARDYAMDEIIKHE
ncbi:MAG: N-acetylneuraminate synthase [Christensenellales bacterium]